MFNRDKQVTTYSIIHGNAHRPEFQKFNERDSLKFERVESNYKPDGYKVSSNSGFAYDQSTPVEVVNIIDRLLALNWHTHGGGFRVRVWYGDVETGQAWGDVETGRIGRSTGWIKIPLMIYNNRSMGGGALLDHCIVRIDRADLVNGERHVFYQHPNFHLPADADQWLLDKANQISRT